MIRLAILEDNPCELKVLKDFINSWADERKREVSLDCFGSLEEFLLPDLGYSIYDGFLLDIELPDGSGMDMAHRLRDIGYKTPIAFITSNDSFVFEGYDVSAIKYILKPLCQNSINSVLNKLYDMSPSKIYSFESHGVSHFASYKDILYFESDGHYIEIFTKDQSYRHRKNISKLTVELGDDFCQCHRTILVNLSFAKTIAEGFVILKDKQKLPLGKKFVDDFKRAYFKFHIGS